MRIAVLGASGFIATRLVEQYKLLGIAEIRPVVRRFQSIAGLSRFDLDCRISDACDESRLRAAFEGCDFVVHAAHGQLQMVAASIAPTYRAANAVGVKRLIYLSSASVHGQSPLPGTDERSRLDDRQTIDYNNHKVRAERRLLRERRTGKTEVVILRPGIVFGPRDRWVSGVVKELQRGTAYLVHEGKGICNSIYVDNLVHAIHLALDAMHVDGEAFLVGDKETLTWKEMYEMIAARICVDPKTIHVVPPPSARSIRAVDKIKGIRITQNILPWIPAKLKRAGKGFIEGLDAPAQSSPWTVTTAARPEATEEMASLHLCSHKLPFEKASKLLKYEPQISVEEGLRRTMAWLRFAQRIQ